ncbi:MAG: BtrH N-terminal domain-containing protein, partial [Candidatus Atribacteria bacterium]|nr:BtrH N-terminal domain-containing protein [Candidatus Atribacteria bacterium]
ILNIPHRVCKSTCFSNGLEDILEWKGKKYINYLLPVLGGMGEFTYLKFKNANPPHMVYWGANTKYLLKDLEKIIDFKEILSENKTFKNTFTKVKEFIGNNQPVVAGALDMYYLHYYPEIYHKKHIPIHYILVVGYDDDKQEVYVQDCGCEGVQKISYSEFEKAINVNVPAMSKKNTIRTFILSRNLTSELEIAQNGLSFRAEKMLKPSVKLFGIPAMKKLAKEIFDWKDKESFEHLVIYATTPPELPKTFEKSNGMRFWKSQVLKKLGKKYKIDKFLKVSEMFQESGKLIIDICKAAMKQDRKKISNIILRVADIEEEAYKILK